MVTPQIDAILDGHVFFGIFPAVETEKLIGRKHAQPFVMRGRQMDGWLRVEPEGLRSKRELQRWVAHGVSHARSLPPKG